MPGQEKTASERLYEAALLRAIMIERYSLFLIKTVEREYTQFLLPELFEELLSRIAALQIQTGPQGYRTRFDTRKMQRVMDAVNEIIDARIGKIQSIAASQLSKLGQIEAEWQTQALRDAMTQAIRAGLGKGSPIPRGLRFAVTFDPPPMEMIRALHKSKPMQGEFLSEWFKTLKRNAQRQVTKAIRQGLLLGEDNREIATRVVGTKGLAYKDGSLSSNLVNARTVVRTAVNHVSSAARQATFEENADVIKAVLWVSTLDDRTSDICQGLDGKTFPIDSGPRPPAHPNCRSVVVPVMKSWKELGIDLNEAGPGTRAALGGFVPDTVTYGDWLRTQPLKIIELALGKKRAQLFLEGRSFKSLFGQDGRYLTLQQLEVGKN